MTDPNNIKLYLAITVSVIGVIFSIVNFVLGKYITAKITNNDLKHITADINELKTDEKEKKLDLKKELQRIFRRLGHIEKQIVKRDTVCELRHAKK